MPDLFKVRRYSNFEGAGTGVSRLSFKKRLSEAGTQVWNGEAAAWACSGCENRDVIFIGTAGAVRSLFLNLCVF